MERSTMFNGKIHYFYVACQPFVTLQKRDPWPRRERWGVAVAKTDLRLSPMWRLEDATWSMSNKCRRSRPRGSVGIAAFLCRWQTAGGGSIPRWSASKTQDRRPAERQRVRTKKKSNKCRREGVNVPYMDDLWWFESALVTFFRPFGSSIVPPVR